jgi:imidazolonepropionase-like amidohydrolase
MLFKAGKPGLKFALGENPKRPGTSVYSTNRRYPASRMGVEDVIRSSFLEAREYARRWDEYEQKKAAGVTPLLPPRRDLKLEPLVEILKGQRLMHVHAYRADEMLMTLRLADELGIKVTTFDHGLEGYKIAKEIAAHGTGVTTFSDWWAYKAEAYDAIPYNAALLTRNGVLVSVNSDGAEESRHLFLEAAKCMKYGGLSENEALALITLNPAKQLQIDKRVGSIDVGKDADLVIFNSYPLSVYAVPEMVFIDGDLYYSRDSDRERQKQLDEIKKQLVAREKPATRKPGEEKEQKPSRQALPSNEEVSR